MRRQGYDESAYFREDQQSSVVIPGASRASQVTANVKAAELAPLSDEQMQGVREIYDRKLKAIIQPQW